MEELYEKYGYPSLEKFKLILKKHNIVKTSKEVQFFLQSQNVHQLHKTVNKNKEKNKFIVALKPFEMIQIDLLDYQKYSKQNKGFKYILIGIDIFTRLAFAEQIKNKTPKNVLEAFLKWKVKPEILYHDSGNEFLGEFLKYVNDKNISDATAEIGNHNSLGVVDRFSRTLKTIISKYMTLHNTTTYINILPKLIDGYNSSPHQSLGNIAPDDIIKNKSNLILVSKINQAKLIYNNSLSKKIVSSIKVGEKVRVKIKKTIFEKGYTITYSKKIYKVEKINGSKALLNDGKQYPIQELQVVNDDSEENEEIDKIAEAEKQAKTKRKLRKEGLDDEYDIRYWEKPK